MHDQPRYDLFAACAPGFEDVTAAELFSLGIAQPHTVPGGVEFRGFLAHLYKVNVWSRTTERVLLRLGKFHALTFKELHDKAKRIAWADWVRSQHVGLRVTCHKSRLIHSAAVAERVVEAIGDRLGRSIERADDDAAPLIIARVVDDVCTISLDTSGALLHVRGYRQATAKAPLRETLAAAMLLASGWTSQRPLLDPFCGAGTIPIEAALMARHIAPGRHRRFTFMDWPNFDRAAWDELLIKADDLITAKAPAIIQGSDRDAGAIEASRSNAARAGVVNDIELTPRAVSAIEPPGEHGWIVTNLPYGHRVSAQHDVRNLYAQFGKVLRAKCSGWHVAMLAGDAQLERSTRLKFDTAIRVDNGGLQVRLAQGTVP